MERDNMSEQNINIRFVKEVQKYPSLYNFELPTYTRRDISDMAWENVGKTMNMTPSACRERWRNLRAVFMRTMKASPKRSTGRKKPYYLSEVMQFVIPFMRPVAKAEVAKEKQILKVKPREESKTPVQIETSSTAQLQLDQIKVEVSDDILDASSEQSIEEANEITAMRKRPVQEEIFHQSVKVAKITQPASSSSVSLDSDHVRSFLNSLIPELNEMNSAQFKNFKRRVLLLIDDIVTEIPGSPRRTTDDDVIM